jgi:hypothetical protein
MKALAVKTLTGGNHVLYFSTTLQREQFLADLDDEIRAETGVSPLYVTKTERFTPREGS